MYLCHDRGGIDIYPSVRGLGMYIGPFGTAEYLAFRAEWYKGKYPRQRLGQAFCNTFNKTDPDLFYQEDAFLADQYIWVHYLGQEP